MVTAGEEAFLALSRLDYEKHSSESPHFHSVVERWMQRPTLFLSALRFSQWSLMGFLFFILLSLFSPSSGGSLLIFSFFSGAAFLVLIFAVQKWAYRSPLFVLEASHLLLTWSLNLYSLLRSGKRAKEPRSKVRFSIYETFFEPEREEGEVTSQILERKFRDHVSELSATRVVDVMTPFNRLFTLEKNKTLGEVLPAIERASYTRIPVLDTASQKVAGILNVQELVNQMAVSATSEDWRSALIDPLLTAPLFFSPADTLDKIFKEFIKQRAQMGIVLDDQGKIAGVVTMTDLLNYLVAGEGV